MTKFNFLFAKKNIPNIITCIRIILTIIIIVLVAYTGTKFDQSNNHISEFSKDSKYFKYWFVAGILFIIAALSDFVDGFLARKWNVTSTFGKFWDPIVDKILINLTVIVIGFYFNNYIPAFIIIIFVFRDIIVDGVRMFLANENVIIPANTYGKTKTIWQLFGIAIIFFVPPYLIPYFSYKHNALILTISQIPLFIATFFSIISGFIYLNELFQIKQLVYKLPIPKLTKHPFNDTKKKNK